ncbi:MAG TPA: primosomal protein N' [Gemmatimonadaceae bacterium]|jgi:primosomal protein N' (replication factor Y)|nr:primosomal protein N' [Gemmatimonadaceae bacterium]
MLIDVALSLPLFRTFSYRVPDGLSGCTEPGARVLVPFRNKQQIGIVMGEAEAREGVTYKDVAAAPDAEPVIDPPMLALCKWIADYYIVPLGVALRCALPALLTGASAPTPSRKTRRVLQIGHELPSLMRRDRIFARAPQQRALYELLEELGGRATVEHLAEQLAFSASVLRGLVARGLAEIVEETIARDPFLSRERRAPDAHEPTHPQRRAIHRLSVAKPGHVALLHGVTGSGKTLVYLELLRRVVLEEGKSAIVLVPEIALTPQTVDRFRAVFGDQIAVLHSALSDGERYDAWLALRRGEKRIAVGARSAVFAPLRNLGAIVVDEEHEGSYKQGEAPRYHAREVAIVRARAEGAVVVLGSATPSLESWTNAQSGKYELLTLPDRAGGAKLPKVAVVDLRGERAKAPPSDIPDADAAFAMAVSPPLALALQLRLDRKEQSILLLNRRGYAAFVQCGTCGDVATCPNCSISLTYHRTPERLVCHYCQHAEALHTSCPRCKGARLRQRGLGTQQVERLLAERYPTARIARMDVDTTSGKWSHTAILDRVGAGEVDILLGTQMIAKGLDFPNVTLVGVIDADVGINLPDFRASERCFQLLSQVAGRAGRGPKGGEVLIQTRSPLHHAVRCAVTHDYHAFVKEELEGRVRPPYPPTLRIANVVLSGTQEEATARLATKAAGWLHKLIARSDVHGVTVIGPAPCPVERVKNRWRWHVLLKAERPQELGRVGRYLVERFEVPKQFGLRLTLDRDPVALL